MGEIHPCTALIRCGYSEDCLRMASFAIWAPLSVFSSNRLPVAWSTLSALPRSMTDEQHLAADEWWLADLAAELAMPTATLHRWQRVGWVASRKVAAAGGRWAIRADPDELDRLRRLRDSPRGWPQPYPTELITPKP